jgi:DedD protein
VEEEVVMVRDLEKLRTRSEFRLRSGHLVLIIAATAIGVGLLFAAGSAFTGKGSADEKKVPARDPFAGLAQAKPAAVEETTPAVSTAVPDPDALPPLQLSFHDRLSQPAPGAAPIVAAAPLPVEVEPIDRPLPVDVVVPAVPMPTASLSSPLPAPVMPLPAPVAPPPVIAVAPAPPPGLPMSAAPVQSVREPMAPPLPPGNPEPVFDEETTPALAQAGERGVFTLQVSSFDEQNDAVAFMNMLRQRGHESFLVRARSIENELIYRVRVGPFESQADAERYRRKFERTERIPTFVVRRTLPTSG